MAPALVAHPRTNKQRAHAARLLDAGRAVRLRQPRPVAIPPDAGPTWWVGLTPPAFYDSVHKRFGGAS